MDDSIPHKASEEIHSLSLQIKTLFLSNSVNTDEKWSVLQSFFTKYLVDVELTPILLSSYHSITSLLLDSLKPTLFTEKYQKELFYDFFLNGIHHEAFIILVRKLESSCESYQQQKIIKLLVKFVKGNSMQSLLLCQCLSSGSWDPKYIAISTIWRDLIVCITSLPERICNKTRGQMNKIFHADCYVPLLLSSTSKVLTQIHHKITKNENCTLEFLGKLIGKLCVLGHGETIAKRLFLGLTKKCESDFIWRKLSQNLITKIPFSSLEPFITSLLLVIPWYGYVNWAIGEEGVKNEKLNYIMTTKLLLVRHFKKEIILQNIIGYFASTSGQKDHFWKIFISLLKVWSDESALKYQSLEQQKHLAMSLIICAGWLKEMKDVSSAQGQIDKVLCGTTIRVGNSKEETRSMGLIVGDLIMSNLGSAFLKWDNEKIVNESLYSDMKQFLVIPSNPGKDSLCLNELNCFDEVESQNIKEVRIVPDSTRPSEQISEVDSDDDDDLKPYDLSNDLSKKQAKRPLYLHDCLRGLIEQEKADWFEQCLRHAESLIEANTDKIHEVAVDMAKVMLHLENRCAYPNFLFLRYRILVSLAVHCPVLVADYLTSQFYEVDYNIRQRLDMLEVLAAASQQLSQPKLAPMRTGAPVLHSKKKAQEATEKIWKKIVDERIAANTRRITKTPKSPLKEMMENRFSAVAGYFFFPLLANYDKKNKSLKLFGEDSYVLARLIYTLGIVMNSASNIPMAKEMGKILLQFLVDVQNHSDTVVREAAIFTMGMVVTSVPGYLLLTDDMTPHVMESLQWLQCVIEKDLDTNCQIRATYVVSVILETMENEMPAISQILKCKDVF